MINHIIKQGQTVYRTKVSDKSDKQIYILKIRHTNFHPDKRADWKIRRKLVF